MADKILGSVANPTLLVEKPMNCKKSLLKIFFIDAKVLMTLALPLMASALIDNSLDFFSTLFLAHLSQKALAAGALVSWVFATVLVVMWGILSSISTLVAHGHGARDPSAIARILLDGLFLAMFMSAPAMIIIWNLGSILLWLGQNPQTIFLAQDYIHALTWAIFPDLVFTTLLHFIIGLGYVRLNLIFVTLWISINIFLNYALVFGEFGLPKLGIAGIGWGTTLSFWLLVMFVVSYVFTARKFRIYLHFLRHPTINSKLKELLHIGLPVGMMYSVEVGFFTCVTLFLGTISDEALSANQITLQFLALVSVISYGLAQAVTVRIGHLVGEDNKSSLQRVGFVGMILAFALMLLIAVVYWIFPYRLIGLDLNINQAHYQKTVELTKTFLMICAFFQLFESIRIVASGALRGLKETHFSLLISILTFWVISLPLGYLLNRQLYLNGQGFWIVMVFSQLLGATMLVYRYKFKAQNFKKTTC